MYPGSARRTTHWPPHLAPIGAIRFARRSSNFAETVRFYRELVGLPLYETFEGSYGSNGVIFGLPSWNLTLEIVEAVDDVAVDQHEQLCLYFPDKQVQQAAMARLDEAAIERVAQHPYWEATGAVTYRDPDGREVVFAPFVYGVNEPGDSSASGQHEFPSD
ncbi:VOC family protein [Mycobacterium shinjukuense]|uniref:VOC family protein n=1 Tax=Mycobacterium shinjukuense TaxID=398694 RepID=UPI0009F2EB40|nr:VOC family protein [Mycobacterium shinjukuense]MCV6984441.1 VOC family protein [Mycobacterium shinjukuense]ORB65833.1 glyoxalase [Mycobacterium shinjukuense]